MKGLNHHISPHVDNYTPDYFIYFNILIPAESKSKHPNKSLTKRYIGKDPNDEKAYLERAAKRIYRYLYFTERIDLDTKVGELPNIRGSWKYNLKKFIEFHQQTYGLKSNFKMWFSNSQTDLAKRKHHIICNANSRLLMEQAVTKLKEAKEKKKQDALITNIDIDTRESIRRAPILSSVLVGNNGKIFTCFKGQGNVGIEGRLAWDKHCEYVLFVEEIRKENLSIVKGGSLYVTLEPCNKRKPIENSNPRQTKIPCAVRCVEAGLAKIYLGSFDKNKSVLGNGKNILETGKYTFELDVDGNPIGKDPEEIEGSDLLEKYFIEKKYNLIESSTKQRVYQIGNQIDMEFFHPDLMLEIYNLNSDFQYKQIKDNELLKDAFEVSPV